MQCADYPLIEIDPILVSPGLDSYCPWAIRAWRYDDVPDQLWDIGSSDGQQHQQAISMKEFYKPMRERASQIIQKYYRFQPYIIRRADAVNPKKNYDTVVDVTTSSLSSPSTANEVCLGIHLRNSDKSGKYRKKIEAKHFLKYIQAYSKAGGKVVYLATDSHRAYQYMTLTLQKNSTNLTDIVLRSQGKYVVRSYKDYPSHMIERRHQVNSEVLVDIVALSRCELLLHTHSTVSEAAIYLNPSLHENSVNMEDPGKLSDTEFQELAASVIRNFYETAD